MKLLVNALVKFICGLLAVGMLLFLPAGALNYPGGLRLAALLFAPMLLLGIVLFVKAPKLLEKRLNHRETQDAQKRVVGFSVVVFTTGFMLAGLDFRFGWTKVPGWLVILASVLLLASYLMYAEVMRENAYLSRTIEVQKGQKVVDTGLYGVVRHPMYAATVVLFLSMPLVLGSWLSLAVFCGYPLLIVVRILNEEKLLRAELAGYEEYTRRVKYRLIPFVW